MNSVEPAGLTPHEKELMHTCARFVSESCDTARYQAMLGKRVEWSLGGGQSFGFLSANHPHNAYYQYLVASFTKHQNDVKAYYAKYYAEQAAQSQNVPTTSAYSSKGASDFHVAAAQKVESSGGSSYYYNTSDASYTMPSGRTLAAAPSAILRDAEDKYKAKSADERLEDRKRLIATSTEAYTATFGSKRARSATPDDE